MDSFAALPRDCIAIDQSEKSVLLSVTKLVNGKRMIDDTRKIKIVYRSDESGENDEILDEYRDVLSRPKFHLTQAQIDTVLKAVVIDGLNLDRTSAEGVDFPDPKDIVFYEVALSKEDSYLVTGNVKHFPVKPFVVTPAEMVKMMEQYSKDSL